MGKTKAAKQTFPEIKKMTYDEWAAEGVQRFGDDMMQWKFECPSCGNVASVQDYKDTGASAANAGYSCIGRWKDKQVEAFGGKSGGQPCNYAGGGLIGLNPWFITKDGREHQYMKFADVAKTK